ncbi:MAG: hypothetical protein UZ04_CHB001000273 [Chlorobi bacterium OLB4]|jgi:hypothetical protein|nr:MAG: hypothetical protein UZ04_CHB001000273 [Chlorobi bacterium OLB4]MBV6399217.1 hypothetical protein [Ignavibacteria bacterium]
MIRDFNVVIIVLGYDCVNADFDGLNGRIFL